MKKVVLLFILFVFSLSQADAQEFHFIPRIGLNLANTYPESFADMRPGLNIGVAEEIRFSKLFALEPGVYYSTPVHQSEYDFSGDKKEEIRNCDFSVLMGLGYTFDMGLVISANYNLGCTHFFKEPEYSFGGSNHFRGKDHNGVIQFNLGWRF